MLWAACLFLRNAWVKVGPDALQIAHGLVALRALFTSQHINTVQTGKGLRPKGAGRRGNLGKGKFTSLLLPGGLRGHQNPFLDGHIEIVVS